MDLFIYSWFTEEDNDTNIRIYGINSQNENICLRIENFTPYVYIELPHEKYSFFIESLCCNIISAKIIYKYNLYNLTHKKTPFLACCFHTKKDINNLVYKLRNPINIHGLGNTLIRVHEQSASSELQLRSLMNIPASGWISFEGKLINEEEKITSCDKEYIVNYKNLKEIENDIHIAPKIIGFDIEVNSENMNSMPCNRPDDVIFQISCVIFKDTFQEKILLTLGSDIKIENINVKEYKSEELLLQGFIDLMKKEKPNVLVGYNILGFDIPYLTKRFSRYFLLDDFKLIGFHQLLPAEECRIKWSSSAYKNQEFEYLDWEGILLIDLLPIVQRDYKMDNYKLQTIASFFLDEGKDPITVKDIFKAYRTLDKNDLSLVGKYCVKDSELVIKLMAHLHIWIGLSQMSKVCNVNMFTLYTQGQQIKIYSQVYKYCLDKNIVVNNDGYIAQENEKYTGAHVYDPIPGFYNKVVPLDFSSLYPSIIIAYNICYSTMVIDENISDDQCNVFEWEDHVGCKHDPKIIKINKLTNIINEYELELNEMRKIRDLITSKTVEKGHKVNETKKKIQEKINKFSLKIKPYRKDRAELTKSKSKFPICAKRKYRFFKPEIQTGIIPIIIKNLLDARKNVKDNIKNLKKEKQDENKQKQIIVLDKEQLAYKVSANSMYGAMGVKRGYLPFMPGAMCITFIGRKSIEKASNIIQTKWNGELVYGDKN